MDEVVGTSGWKLAKPETVLFSGEGCAGWISWACAGDRGSQNSILVRKYELRAMSECYKVDISALLS